MGNDRDRKEEGKNDKGLNAKSKAVFTMHGLKCIKSVTVTDVFYSNDPLLLTICVLLIQGINSRN